MRWSPPDPAPRAGARRARRTGVRPSETLGRWPASVIVSRRRARRPSPRRGASSSSKLFWKLATPSRSSCAATSSMSTPTSASRPHGLGLVDVGVDRAGQRAVVGERLDRRVGHRVDGVRPDQLVDVQRVRVVRVLRRRARPQRALDRAPRAASASQRAPLNVSPEQLVGELALGDRRLAAQRQRLGVPIASSRRSTSVSTREMKKLATLATVERSAPGGGVGLEARRGRRPSPRGSARG